jgi:hypothetical protein
VSDARKVARVENDAGLFMKRFEPPLLTDEIQYAPTLMPYIKMAVDSSKKTGLFWLTGSQQFIMMKGISETFAGRVAIINLLGFSERERHRLNLDAKPFLPNKKGLNKRLEHARKTNLKRVETIILTLSGTNLKTVIS